MKIAIIGAGAYGTALGGIIAANGYDIDYYDPKREPERLKDVVSGAQMVLLSAPSEVAIRLLKFIPKSAPLIVASKGFLSDEPFQEFMKWGVISGPGFAQDIKAGHETRLTITAEWIRGYFTAEYLKFDLIEDRKAVLMCGALKNVYAILAGRSGLTPHTRAMRDFIRITSQEMKAILSANGADEKAADSPCGTPDLELTCSNGSRNFGFGQALRNGEVIDPPVTVEGVTALKRIKNGAIIVPDSAHYMQALMQEFSTWV